MRVLVGVTGSVATIKLPQLLEVLNSKEPVQVRIVATQAALHFIDSTTLSSLKEFYTDNQEWDSWKKVSDPVLHIELRNWADIFLIAPLDANTLGKLANGLCDNLLTCIARAWDPRKPIIVSPAMNTFMYEHPLTAKHLTLLQELLNYTIIPPIRKKLACGDEGIGAMAEPKDIVSVLTRVMQEYSMKSLINSETQAN